MAKQGTTTAKATRRASGTPRRRLLDAARTLFARQDYRTTTTRELTETGIVEIDRALAILSDLGGRGAELLHIDNGSPYLAARSTVAMVAEMAAFSPTFFGGKRLDIIGSAIGVSRPAVAAGGRRCGASAFRVETGVQGPAEQTEGGEAEDWLDGRPEVEGAGGAEEHDDELVADGAADGERREEPAAGRRGDGGGVGG
jgi:hypothetical protein